MTNIPSKLCICKAIQ